VCNSANIKPSTTECVTVLVSNTEQVNVLKCYYQDQHEWLCKTNNIKNNTTECVRQLISKPAQLTV